MLLGQYFSDTCAVAEEGNGIVGFATGFVPRHQPEVLFVWQMGVHPDYRGRKLAAALIDDILRRPVNAGIRFIETTVGPSNAPSRNVFKRLAEKSGSPLTERTLFTQTDFGSEPHEDEVLIRVGPFQPIKEESA